MNICKLLDEALVENQKLRRAEHGDKKSHYPSESCDCNRKLYYRWLNAIESNPTEGNNLLKMSIGNVICDYVFSIIEKQGVEIIQEIEFRHTPDGFKYPISGRIDYLFKDLDGQLTGVEVKTISGYGTDAIIKANFPREEHLAQVGIYCACTDIKRFIILYIDQQKSFKKQFSVNYIDNKMYVEDALYEGFNFAKVVDKFRILEEKKLHLDLPNRDFSVAIVDGEIKSKFTRDKVEYKTDWHCDYCNYRDTCWDEVIVEAKKSGGKWFNGQQIA